MVLLTVEGISKAYGARTLFADVSFGVHEGDKIGIIGPNGSGKSTLLKIIAGVEVPDAGQVVVGRQVRVEYVAQKPTLDDDLTALEQVLADGPREFEVVQAYERALLALQADPTDAGCLDKVARLGEEMDRVGGWTLEAEAKATLGALGLHDPQMKVGHMSGGQRRRLAIARGLIRPSDLLILDEPTNHLDAETVTWLEARLQARQGALLLITHDRYILERVTGVMLELDQQQLYRHEGNYSAFLESRAARMEHAATKEQRRKQLAKQELAWLRRGPPARTTKSKSRIQRANDLLNTSYAREDHKAEIDSVMSRLGRKIMSLDGVSRRFGDKKIVEDLTYTFQRGERVGIVGPNGAGKSTLLNMLTGRDQPDEGVVDVGETVVFGYYDQESQGLEAGKRAHEVVTDIAHHIPTRDGTISASQLLERFLFTPDRQWTPVEKLSGGEQRRLYLCRVLMAQPNVLILDEPTNDLDVETLGVLEDFLEGFDGVLLVVSHDRYFLDRVVDHLLVFEGEGVISEFPGPYSAWAEEVELRRREDAAAAREREAARQQAATAAAAAKPDAEAKPKKRSFKEQRELEQCEGRIEALEEEIATLDAQLVEHATDFERLHALDARRREAQQELDAVMERWMELEELG